MPDVFSYCIPTDDGAAPNPFWGVCTLVICKPRIRSAAEVGDWVVGTGSHRSPIGDIGNHVVYAMRVTEKLTMQKYNSWTQRKLPEKIPDWSSDDYRRRAGDSIYDTTVYPYVLRASVHNEGNRKRDLSGKYALLSTHFYYFGNKPLEMPAALRAIIKDGRSHRRVREQQLVAEFVAWIDGQGLAPNSLLGEPQCRDLEKRCVLDEEEDEGDE
jgi:hypothetical protein